MADEAIQITIYKTTNYNQFKSIKGNRKVDEAHVRAFQELISEKDFLDEAPILITPDKEIKDGQHRLEAAKRSKKPIYYRISQKEGNVLEQVQLLNVGTRNWSEVDFLESYIKNGKKDYAQLKEFITKYELGLSTGVLLLASKQFTGRHILMRLFRKGKFMITNSEQALSVVEKLQELRPYMMDYVYSSRVFIRIFITIFGDNDALFEEFFERLKISGKRIPALALSRDYQRFFSDVLAGRKRFTQF